MDSGSAPRTLTDSAYEALLAMILNKELVAGQILEERALSERLNVSRTPLRIAMGRLYGEGFMVRASNGLHAVSALNTEDYLDLLNLRRLLECDAVARAAGRMSAESIAELRGRITALRDSPTVTVEQQHQLDDDLHDIIAKASGNRWLATMIEKVRRHARMCNVQRLPNRWQESCNEHLAILDALEARNAEAARQAMERHLDAVWSGFMKMLQQR